MGTEDIEGLRFCPHCGHEGTDVDCPVCHLRMESLEEEVERIGKIEDETKEIFDDLSLEAEGEKENKKEDRNAGP